MENALDCSSGALVSKIDFIIGVRAEFGVEDPYIERCLGQFFDAFNCDRPRSLELLCVYMTVTFSKLIEESPRKLILKLCEMCSSKDAIHIDNVKMIVDLGYCASDCYNVNASTTINSMAQLHLGKKEVNMIQILELSEILDRCPRQIVQFGENVQERLPSMVRVEILSNNQKSAELSARKCSQKVVISRSVELWRHLLVKAFRAWTLLSEEAREKHLLEHRMWFWKARRLMLSWSQTVQDSKTHRELKAVEEELSSWNRKKRYLRLWKRVTREKTIYSWQPRQLRKIALGCSLVNNSWKKALSKKLLSKWHNEVELHHRFQNQKRRHKEYYLRFHFTLWKQSIENSKLQKLQTNHQRSVLSIMQEMNKGSSIERNSEYALSDQNELYSNRKEQESAEMRARALKRQLEDADLSLLLKEQEKSKTHQCSQQLKWANDENRRLGVVKIETEKWFSSQDGREMVTQFVKTLERELQFPSVLSTSPSTIALSCLDSKLGDRGLVSDEFFERLETAAKDGKVNVSELHDYVEKQKCRLPSSSIQEIFDGEIGTRIAVQDLKKRLNESRSWAGTAEGCQWKRFIDPIRQTIGYHNFVENKIIFEHKLSKKNKIAIARDHYLSTNIVRERKLMWRERKKYYEK